MRALFRRSSSSAATATGTATPVNLNNSSDQPQPRPPTGPPASSSSTTTQGRPRNQTAISEDTAGRSFIGLPLPSPSTNPTTSIPIPTRRASEPPERWAQPTLPSYAVSRDRDPQVPSYDVAVAHSPPATSTGRSIEGTGQSPDARGLRSLSDYFGLPSDGAGEGEPGGTGSRRRPTSPFSPTEDPFMDLEPIDEDDDLPFLLPSRPGESGSASTRRNTFSGTSTSQHALPSPSGDMSTSLQDAARYLDITPPAALPPAYTAQAGRDELRLISTVHVPDDHPAAAFLNAATIPPAPSTSPTASTTLNPSTDPANTTTGRKKLKLSLTKGGVRLNSNGTGPLYVRMPRAGVVEGTIEVGKVDHAIGLEVSIFGYINTSYYMRGQQSLLDTLPLIRNKSILFPPRDLLANQEAPSHPSTSETFSTTSTSTADVEADDHPVHRTNDGQRLLNPGQTFAFSLKMPLHHYRDDTIELPPSCSINQVGLQTQIEYVLRVKLIRKGWRLNETIVVPIWYQPRGYISPGRLSFLTIDEPLNPGWRTVHLRGGGPVSAKAGSDHTAQTGVEATLMLPSPSLIHIPHGQSPPPIPFHLHFHSNLTLPLSTFSDPRQCIFVVRFTRVAVIRLGIEKQVHRFEIPSEVEVWQEGGARMTLRHGRVVVNEQNDGIERTSSTSAIATEQADSGSVSADARRGSVSGLGASERRRSFAERRASFSLRRRLSNPASPAGTGTGTSDSSRLGGSLPRTVTPISEEHPASPASATSPTSPITPTSTSTTSANRPLSPHPAPGPSADPLPPLSLSSTDVHLLGSLQIKHFPGASHGSDLTSQLIQSFNTPEVSVLYVLEFGCQPRSGAVKEAFKSIWGGGVVDVVLGSPGR